MSSSRQPLDGITAALVRLLGERHVTQELVAAACGCDRSLVSRWASRDVPIPSYAPARLARAGYPQLLEALCDDAGGRFCVEELHVDEAHAGKPCPLRGLERVTGATEYAQHAIEAEADGVWDEAETVEAYRRADREVRAWEQDREIHGRRLADFSARRAVGSRPSGERAGQPRGTRRT